MDDLYFNELSVDFSVSKQPKDKEEAKKLLLKFVKTCFSYILSCGKGADVCLLKNDMPFYSIRLTENTSINELINELEEEGAINHEESGRFKAFITESFEKEWNPEYLFDKQLAVGLGEAHRLGCFSISLILQRLYVDDNWNHSQFTLTKISADCDDEIVFVKHLAVTEHVFDKYKVWEKCSFINKKPQTVLLPNKNTTASILDIYNIEDWDAFYKSVQKLPKSQIRKIGKLVAILNGWDECKVKGGRPTYNSKNYYIAIDTQHATFEVYEGTNNHLGEITFADDIIDTSKKKKTRKIELTS